MTVFFISIYVMTKILINAYACSPGMGSEPGMAWNWVVNLAKHCELHIITEGEFKDEIEKQYRLWSKVRTCISIIIRSLTRLGECAGTKATGDFISITANGNGKHISWRKTYALQNMLIYYISSI